MQKTILKLHSKHAHITIHTVTPPAGIDLFFGMLHLRILLLSRVFDLFPFFTNLSPFRSENELRERITNVKRG